VREGGVPATRARHVLAGEDNALLRPYNQALERVALLCPPRRDGDG
jgi:hypothetical protein